jgi:DNA-binding SARP family transcriptional activator
VRVRSLLAYVALRPGDLVSRAELAAALWPESDEGTTRQRLRNTVWKLRLALRPFISPLPVSVTEDSVAFTWPRDSVDVNRFKHLITTSGGDQDALREAIDLYDGDLLADVDDEWVSHDRYHCQALFLRAIKQLVGALISGGAGATAMQYAVRGVNMDPTDEELSYAFMQAAVLAGQPAAALAQYDTFARALKSDVGIAPAPHVRALSEEIGHSLRDRARTYTNDLLLPIDQLGKERDRTRLTGRTIERQQLLEAVRRTQEGHGTAIVITGAAGVGKTALAEAIVRDVHEKGIQVYKARCSDIANPPPYHVVVEALWPELSMASVEQSPVLTALLPTLLPRANRRRTDLLGAESFDAALISESLLRVLPSLDDPPVLLMFDDVHRADHATWVWLMSLLRRLTNFHVCMILTARTGETDDQDQLVSQLISAGAEAISLEPFGPDQIRTLISTVLETPRSLVSLCRAISRYIGGNPLQILEAIRLLKGRGLLRLSGGTWTMETRAPEMLAALATSHVNTLVKGRLVLLPDATRNVLSAAAVFGMEITSEQLRGLSGLSHRRFLIHVERLISQRLLICETNGVLRFPHEEIRNAVLDRVSFVRRRLLHVRAAQLLAQAKSARPEDLWWHYEGAGDSIGALSAATNAGDSSYALGEHASAIGWYDRALAILSGNDMVDDPRARLTLELKLEAALSQHGDRPRLDVQ